MFLFKTEKTKAIRNSDFWLRWQHRQTWLTSLHNHIKITTKIQNNNHAGMSEIKLNRSLTTMELKKPHPSKPVGGVQMKKGLIPHLCVVDKHSGEISWEQGVPNPHQDLQPGVPVPGR